MRSSAFLEFKSNLLSFTGSFVTISTTSIGSVPSHNMLGNDASHFLDVTFHLGGCLAVYIWGGASGPAL